MKKIICILVCVFVLTGNVLASTDDLACGLASIINLSMGCWGFSTGITFGYVAGSYFMIKGVGNLSELALK